MRLCRVICCSFLLRKRQVECISICFQTAQSLRLMTRRAGLIIHGPSKRVSARDGIKSRSRTFFFFCGASVSASTSATAAAASSSLFFFCEASEKCLYSSTGLLK